MEKIVLKFLLFLLFFLLPNYVSASCEDRPGDGVDYQRCQFADEQDLAGSYLPNSNLSLTSFIKVNFDKSIMLSANLSNGNFAEASFYRANLYEANLEGGNFEKANFESANLTRVNFKGSSLIGTNFKNSNLFGSDFTGSNILDANFEAANLNEVIWIDGRKCLINSIGICK